ncbi:MAG: lactate utilization protein [Candidatus Bathyarchaeota archaeon]|nr:MAG: lactate utilization protein [Candidatus Bathyarchaeota archaeon]
MDEVKQWYLDKRIERTLQSLKENGFETIYAPNRAEAAKEIVALIPSDALVGIGGSITVRELGLLDALSRRGNRVAQHWQSAISSEERMEIRRTQLISDVFLTSSNAITESGQLVNVDGTGNRVAAMIFGPKKVIVVAGMNKIVRDLDGAIERVNSIAAPMNAMRLGCQTPCVANGVCTDCESSDRICSVTTIINRRPGRTDFTIVLVGEELGY